MQSRTVRLGTGPVSFQTTLGAPALGGALQEAHKIVALLLLIRAYGVVEHAHEHVGIEQPVLGHAQQRALRPQPWVKALRFAPGTRQLQPRNVLAKLSLTRQTLKRARRPPCTRQKGTVNGE